MHWMILPLRRYADFRGRAQRIEYWMFLLFLFLAFAVTEWLDTVLPTGGSTATVLDTGPGLWAYSSVTHGGWITALFGLAMLVPWLAVSVRRLHDIGRSGWWLLLAILPLIGGIVLLVFDLTDSQRGANRFGPDPKAIGDGAA